MFELVEFLRDCSNLEVLITEASGCSRESMESIVGAVSAHARLRTILVNDEHVGMHKLALPGTPNATLTSMQCDQIDFARSVCSANLARDPIV
jgi:hypothetical protein